MANHILDRSPLFGLFGEKQRREILDLCSRETHKAGEELFESGQQARHLYILEHGHVALVIRTEAREEVILSTLSKPGDVIAWSALVEPRVLTASAECLTDTRLLKVDAAALESLMDEHPEEGLAFMRMLAALIASRLKDTQRRLIGAVF